MLIDVEVANSALSKLGEDDQIRDPDEDGKAARTIRANWEATRKLILRSHKWNFAMGRWELPARAGQSLIDQPVIGWTHAFPLPIDCLRLVEILEPELSKDDYQLEGGEILADTAGPLRIRGVRDIHELARWDALAIEAFASRLAFQCADRLTGDRGRKKDAWDNYKSAIRDAKHVDALENPPVEHVKSSWETARLS